ncbi:MAG: fasciclin domain-containing protein, partial [Acidimicrobiia bacterium]
MRARRTSLAAAVAVFALVGAACSDDSSTSTDTTAAPTATTAAVTSTTEAEAANGLEGGPYDIVATALSRSDLFSQLAGYVVNAKLVETLKTPGPFTVFAPTDDAFAKIPLDTLHSVTDNPELLTTVLTYHVVPGKLKVADLKPGKLKTVAGPELTISKSGDATYVNGNKIALGDIEATNGEIHVMGDVLVPPVGDIVTVATSLKGFSTLATLVTNAGLIDTLKGAGPFTVFAPVDAAFAALPKATLDAVGADKA